MLKVWLPVLAVIASVQAAEISDPRVLVDATIETLRENVHRDQALIEGDPEYAMQLVEGILSPFVDLRLTGRLVLGAHWKEATAAQREAFVDGLRRLLLRVFALHVSDYQEAEVAYSPTVFKGKNQQRAVVRTEVTREGVPPVAVDYRLYRSIDGWKVYDVSIFGVSLLKTYHITIQYDLKKHGLDGVIEQINAKVPLTKADSFSPGTASPAG